ESRVRTPIAEQYSDQRGIHWEERNAPSFQWVQLHQSSGAMGGEFGGWRSQRGESMPESDDCMPQHLGGQSLCRIDHRPQQHYREQLRTDSVSSVAAAVSAVHGSHYRTADDWQFHLSRVAVARREEILERVAVSCDLYVVEID